MNLDWHQLLSSEAYSQPIVTDSRRRLRWMFAGFLLVVFVILARLWSLEATRGELVRRQASEPLLRVESLPAPRGRILARDGTVLAEDRELRALKLHYRHLEEPPRPEWLAYQARRRLSRAARRDPQQMQAAIAQLRVERAEMHRRLAALASLPLAEYNARRRRIQQRVERIADDVNARHAERAAAQPQSEPQGIWGWIVHQLRAPESDAPRRITIAEELDYHTVAEALPADAALKIERHPQHFPGVQIETHRGRAYPQGALAAHLVGHLGAPAPGEARPAQADDEPHPLVGRLGSELQHEAILRGKRGQVERQLDRRGETLASRILEAPTPGADVTLTIDPALQRSAEQLLDSALARRASGEAESLPAGGAVVVLDCQSGALLACASAPRFDPNTMLRGSSAAITALLTDDRKPLFDRATRMALPPGSVMKTLTALALVEERAVDPQETFFCQGYLHQPDRMRCAVFRQLGVGHDELDLTRALAESCNVYFFHHAARLGPERLVGWARRLGLGAVTGVDLPYEAAGNLPTPGSLGRPWRTSETQLLAIGQSELTTTPLQIARLMAAVANGGRLVTPHVVEQLAPPARPITGLSPATLAAVQKGLEQAVFDAAGTAHAALFLQSVAVAAKTGTAQTGGGRPDHAWVAGYAPARAPRIAFAVALEHAGGGGEAAGPVAGRLVARMQELGHLR